MVGEGFPNDVVLLGFGSLNTNERLSSLCFSLLSSMLFELFYICNSNYPSYFILFVCGPSKRGLLDLGEL